VGLAAIHSSFLGSRISSRIPLDSGFSSASVRLGDKHRFRGQSVMFLLTWPVQQCGDEYKQTFRQYPSRTNTAILYDFALQLVLPILPAAAVARHFQ
jgi:hypothetical protein